MQASLPVFALRFQSSRAIIPNQIQMQIKAPCGQMRSGSVWPLDQGETVLRLVPAKFEHLAWIFQSIQVEMKDREGWPIICLDEGIGWARHFRVLTEER